MINWTISIDNILLGLITLISSLIVVLYSLKLYKKRIKHESRTKHFDKIKKEVFEPLLRELDAPTFFEMYPEKNFEIHKGVNTVLFRDLKNHYNEILEMYKEKEHLQKNKNNIIKKLKDDILTILKRIKLKSYNMDLIKDYVINPAEEIKPIIKEGKLITKSGSGTYAEGEGFKLKKLEKMISKLTKSDKVIEIRQTEQKIQKIKEQLVEIINELINQEKLKGECYKTYDYL